MKIEHEKEMYSRVETLRSEIEGFYHLKRCVEVLLEGYEFHMTDVLDANRRCVPQKNRAALHQLDRAFGALGGNDGARV